MSQYYNPNRINRLYDLTREEIKIVEDSIKNY